MWTMMINCCLKVRDYDYYCSRFDMRMRIGISAWNKREQMIFIQPRTKNSLDPVPQTCTFSSEEGPKVPQILFGPWLLWRGRERNHMTRMCPGIVKALINLPSLVKCHLKGHILGRPSWTPKVKSNPCCILHSFLYFFLITFIPSIATV